MNLVVNNLTISESRWVGACCSDDMNDIGVVSNTVGTKVFGIQMTKVQLGLKPLMQLYPTRLQLIFGVQLLVVQGLEELLLQDKVVEFIIPVVVVSVGQKLLHLTHAITIQLLVQLLVQLV